MTRWRVIAKCMLVRGYGVEDISVETGVDVEKVRRLVTAMRKRGLIAKMFNGNDVGSR